MSDSEELNDIDAVLRFRMREEDALERFLDEWRKLPPLVRAAKAEHLRLAAVRSLQGCQSEEKNQRETGLRRRAAVNRAFVTAETAMHSLWCELCSVADEEADSLGQGPLVRAADLLETPPLVIDKERVEKQITDLLSTAMPGETVAEQIESERARRGLEPLKREETVAEQLETEFARRDLERLKREETNAFAGRWALTQEGAHWVDIEIMGDPAAALVRVNRDVNWTPFSISNAALAGDALVLELQYEPVEFGKAVVTLQLHEGALRGWVGAGDYDKPVPVAGARIETVKAVHTITNSNELQAEAAAAHPHCWKCKEPYRPAYAPLAPDTLVPSCKCDPRGPTAWRMITKETK